MSTYHTVFFEIAQKLTSVGKVGNNLRLVLLCCNICWLLDFRTEISLSEVLVSEIALKVLGIPLPIHRWVFWSRSKHVPQGE